MRATHEMLGRERVGFSSDLPREEDAAFRRDAIRDGLSKFLEGYFDFRGGLQNSYDYAHYFTWETPFLFWTGAFWGHDEQERELVIFSSKESRYPVVPSCYERKGEDSCGADIQNENYHLFQINKGGHEVIVVLEQSLRLPHWSMSHNGLILTTPTTAVQGIKLMGELENEAYAYRVKLRKEEMGKCWCHPKDIYVGRFGMIQAEGEDAEGCHEIEKEIRRLKRKKAKG